MNDKASRVAKFRKMFAEHKQVLNNIEQAQHDGEITMDEAMIIMKQALDLWVQICSDTIEEDKAA